jgi:hypothetical protein
VIINNALAAIVSNNSSSTEPATTFAFQWWADTNNTLLKIRNAANSAWVTVGDYSTVNLGLLTSATANSTYSGIGWWHRHWRTGDRRRWLAGI